MEMIIDFPGGAKVKKALEQPPQLEIVTKEVAAV